MKPTPLLRTVLPVLSFVFAFTGAAVLSLSGAAPKAPTAKKSGEKNAAAKPDENRPPLKISVDRKPINRDAADRISYAPVIKRTASSVVYVYSTKTVRGQDLSQYFNDPLLRRFFDLPGI